jgi:serine/threonine protein kinase
MPMQPFLPDSSSPDNERTMLMPRRDVDSALKVGHRLKEYVVQDVVGVGGFSIVYRMHDTLLDRTVAVKEYMPAALGLRHPLGVVVPRTPRHKDHFELGLRSFVKEARLLASFDHPALLKVFRYWEEMGTAYMVMPFYEGLTFKKWLAHLGVAPSETWLRQMAGDMTDALAILHHQKTYHRDVAPDNILMLFDRHAGPFLEQRPHPELLDFGAARRVVSDATQNLTAILKSGYSPVEQYASTEGMKQGAWTDVYALSAVLYTAITGKPPPAAVSRYIRDDMVPAVEAGKGRYSEPFLAAIDAGLTVRPEDRPQSMAQFAECLASEKAAKTTLARAQAAKLAEEKKTAQRKKEAAGGPRFALTRHQGIALAGVGVALAAAIAAVWRWLI